MFFSKTIVSLLVLTATLVNGAAIKRQGADNGSCAQLGRICAGRVDNSLSNVWGVEACLFAGVCYERNGTTLDAFLANLWVTEGHTGTPPTSLNTPRVTPAVFDAISTDGGNTITQQNYIDGYYSTLDATGGPYPTNPSVVIADFNRVAEWTGFCGTGIPEQNWADYFQYSATNPAQVCTA